MPGSARLRCICCEREEIQRYDPQMLCFRNVNTPEELQEAEELALSLNSQTGVP